MSFLEGITSILQTSLKAGGVIGSITLIALYFKQNSLLYYPAIGNIPRRPQQNPSGYRSPSEYNLPFEDHMIKTADNVNIHAWLLIHDETPQLKPTIIFFHGNAGNIGFRLPNARSMFHSLNVNVLMVEYRGYGNSDDAEINEAGLKTDSEAALHFIMNHKLLASSTIFIFGRSLGGAAAFHLGDVCQRNNIPLGGIIVENTFLSISKMVDSLMPLVASVKWLVLRIGWNSELIAPTLTFPILYLAGTADEIVPHKHMTTLHILSGEKSLLARIYKVRGGTHNETWIQGGQAYWQAFGKFMRDVSEGNFMAGGAGKENKIQEVEVEVEVEGGGGCN